MSFPLRASQVQPLAEEGYCPLVQYASVADYRRHFIDTYCAVPLQTFDLISVSFQPTDFGHAFFEGKVKEWFSPERAERIDWIGAALQDDAADLYLGWDRNGDSYTTKRRVCVADGDYVVVIEFSEPNAARFVTAFIATDWTLDLLAQSPNWRK